MRKLSTVVAICTFSGIFLLLIYVLAFPRSGNLPAESLAPGAFKTGDQKGEKIKVEVGPGHIGDLFWEKKNKLVKLTKIIRRRHSGDEGKIDGVNCRKPCKNVRVYCSSLIQTSIACNGGAGCVSANSCKMHLPTDSCKKLGLRSGKYPVKDLWKKSNGKKNPKDCLVAHEARHLMQDSCDSSLCEMEADAYKIGADCWKRKSGYHCAKGKGEDCKLFTAESCYQAGGESFHSCRTESDARCGGVCAECQETCKQAAIACLEERFPEASLEVSPGVRSNASFFCNMQKDIYCKLTPTPTPEPVVTPTPEPVATPTVSPKVIIDICDCLSSSSDCGGCGDELKADLQRLCYCSKSTGGKIGYSVTSPFLDCICGLEGKLPSPIEESIERVKECFQLNSSKLPDGFEETVYAGIERSGEIASGSIGWKGCRSAGYWQ